MSDHDFTSLGGNSFEIMGLLRDEKAALLADNRRLRDALTDAFIISVSGDGDPYIKVQFKDVAAAQRFHLVLSDYTKRDQP